MLCLLSGRYPFFRCFDDMTALAQIISLFGKQRVTDSTKQLGKLSTPKDELKYTFLNYVKRESQWISKDCQSRWGRLNQHVSEKNLKIVHCQKMRAVIPDILKNTPSTE